MKLNSPRSRILLTGAGRYDELPAIPAVAANLADLRSALARAHEPDPIRASVVEVRDPTVQKELSAPLREAAAADLDVLVFYYAGHGVLDEHQQLHLAVTSTDPTAVPESALSFAVVRRILSQAVARVRVVVLDCCFSGRSIDSGMADPGTLVAGQIDVRGTYTLASSSRDLASLAPPGERNTAFTGALLGVLGSGTTALTVGDLALELRRTLSAGGLPDLEFRSDDTAGQLVIAPERRSPTPADPFAERTISAKLRSSLQWVPSVTRALLDCFDTPSDWVVEETGRQLWLGRGSGQPDAWRRLRVLPVPLDVKHELGSVVEATYDPDRIGVVVVAADVDKLARTHLEGAEQAARYDGRLWLSRLGRLTAEPDPADSTGAWVVHWPYYVAATDRDREVLRRTVRELTAGW
jgi:hypothetical protein